MRRRHFTLLLAIFLIPSLAQADDRLWERLKTEENLVVLMRHARATGGQALKWDETGKCRGELVLSATGKGQARKIGEAFAARGIKPLVVSSPMCRCLETARIAFGSTGVTDPDLREVASADPSRTQAYEAKARLLLKNMRGKTPVAFVSHRPNIDLLTMELLDEDVLLVGSVDDEGEIEVLGRIDLPRGNGSAARPQQEEIAR